MLIVEIIESEMVITFQNRLLLASLSEEQSIQLEKTSKLEEINQSLQPEM